MIISLKSRNNSWVGNTPESVAQSDIIAHPKKIGAIQRLQNRIFECIHSSGLIYNTCWEDPRIDRALLQLGPDSRVVMITSAGCNALDYLLDGPHSIHCIDMNFRQNALLYLRMAMIKVLDYDDFFNIFANGRHHITHSKWQRIYRELPDDAVNFWKKKKHYFFNGNRIRPSFYYHGTAGTVAWIFMGYMRKIQPKIYQEALKLIDAGSLAEQKQIYHQIESRLWNRFSRWLVRQPILMSMMGVPRSQTRLIDRDFPGNLTQYVAQKLKYVLTEVPIQDNYFWRVYISGAYTANCCPNYLKEENYIYLRDNLSRITLYTSTLTDFLKDHRRPYTHFILLDHLDWLADYNPAALAEEWRQIFACSKPGSSVLFRSAGLNLSFLPRFVLERLEFKPELTEPLDKTDRVGTYGSLHFAYIQ